MKKIPTLICVIILVMLIFVSGCTEFAKSDPSDATKAYLTALAEKDKNKVISLSCKAFEEQSALEVDALLSVGASLNDLQCASFGKEGEYQLVKCSGNMDLTYNDEIRAIDLSTRIYSMALEEGKWRVCSYK